MQKSQIEELRYKTDEKEAIKELNPGLQVKGNVNIMDQKVRTSEQKINY